MNKLLIICGPTATGKTSLAATLSKEFQTKADRTMADKTELISADSRQVYKGMDIVTGKDKPKGIIIHGLDLVKPDQDFSVAHFVKFTRPIIAKLHKKNVLPILVGGTGLYLDAIVKPIQTISIPPDQHLRQTLEKLDINQLQSTLKSINFKHFKNMNHSDQNNPRRLIRAIEITHSHHLQGGTLKVNYDVLWVGLKASKIILNKRIKERVVKRLKRGALKEKQLLQSKGYSKNLPSMSSIGYKHLPDIKAWIKAEQQYARRQLTWFNKNSKINWFDITKPDFNKSVVSLVSSWYTK